MFLEINHKILTSLRREESSLKYKHHLSFCYDDHPRRI